MTEVYLQTLLPSFLVNEPESKYQSAKISIKGKCLEEMMAIHESMEHLIENNKYYPEALSYLKSISVIGSGIIHHLADDYELKVVELFNLMNLMLNEFRKIFFIEKRDDNKIFIFLRYGNSPPKMFYYFYKSKELEIFTDPPYLPGSNYERKFFHIRQDFINFIIRKSLIPLSIDNKLMLLLAFMENFTDQYDRLRLIRNKIQHNGNLKNTMEEINVYLLCEFQLRFIKKLSERTKQLIFKE